MEQKREMTSVDLAAVVRELGSFEGAKLDKAYLYGDDLLRLKLRDFDRGRVELMVEVGDVKRAHTTRPERVPDAPGRPPNFAMMLRNRIAGGDFAGVEQYGFDRILEFKFEREDGNTSVVVELFGQGNVAVLDGNRKVLACLETVRLKSRTVAPGMQYEFPAARLNPLEVSYEGFVARMEESDTDLVRTLATQLNFGGLYAEELCTRAGVEKAKDVADAEEDDFERLYAAIERLTEQLRTGEFDPRVYSEDDERVDVTPFPIEEHESMESEAFDTFNQALDDYFTNLDLTEDETVAEAGKPDFQAEIEKRKRIIDQQQGAIDDFEAQAQAERERAELLYANYGFVDDILTTVRNARAEEVPWDDIAARFAEGADRGIPEAEAVRDVDGSTGTVTVDLDDTAVELDVSMGVEKNADRLYTEAKRVEEKKEGALAAIEDTREQLEAARERKTSWERESDEDEATADEEEETPAVDWLARSSIPVRKNDQWYERFRWFRTSDGFLVIGGRNADQNEELVKKYLDKEDRFFHSQAHGGPVTILKATEPSEPARDVDLPDRSKREAAQFAVSYSSVWKDGRFSGDAYMVRPDQVSKTPESGEYIEKGGFVIRGDRTYFRDVEASVAVGITCEPDTRVVGGPPDPIVEQAEAVVRLEPGKYAQNDAAKRIYREFRERFADTSFVRKVASPDRIQEFLSPGGSEMVD